jgi:hypothetical protein
LLPVIPAFCRPASSCRLSFYRPFSCRPWLEAQVSLPQARVLPAVPPEQPASALELPFAARVQEPVLEQWCAGMVWAWWCAVQAYPPFCPQVPAWPELEQAVPI